MPSTTGDTHDDLAADLRKELLLDPHYLHKNQAMVDRLTLAAVENKLTWSRVRSVLKELGHKVEWQARLMKAAREMQNISSIGGDPVPSSLTVHDAFPGVPEHLVSQDAEAPPGWGYAHSKGAIVQIVRKETREGEQISVPVPISYEPIVISRRFQHMDTGDVMLELAWRTGAKWHTRTYDRATVFSKRALVAS